MPQGLEATAGILMKLCFFFKSKGQGTTTASRSNVRLSVELSPSDSDDSLDGFVENGKLCEHANFWYMVFTPRLYYEAHQEKAHQSC